jgi:hypothetical protein
MAGRGNRQELGAAFQNAEQRGLEQIAYIHPGAQP